MNYAQFTISGTPASQRGYDVDPSEDVVLQLEAVSQLVGRVTFEIGGATSGATALTLAGATSGQSVDATTPSSVVHLTGFPPVRSAHAWKIRCKVNGGLNQDGSVNPDFVFERIIAMRSVSGQRKILFNERSEYDPTESWAGAFNDNVDAYALGVNLAEPSLIELLDADSGIGTIGGYIAEWRGLRGHVARPLNKTMTASGTAFSGNRTGIVFNGTSHGMTLELPELRYNSASLIIAAQFMSDDANAYQMQCITELQKLTGGDTSVLRLDLPGGGSTTRTVAHTDADELRAAARTGLNYIDAELVGEVIRDSHGSLLHVFVNGTRVDPDGAAQIDVLSPQPSSSTVSIGFSLDPSAPGYFAGAIRRIAIYGYTQTTQLAANALSRDAAWRGH